ncbi:MAG: MFS transporter [Terriglobales bacterium]
MRTRVRYLIVFMIFFASTVNYAVRATLSITGSDISKELGLNAVAMGYVFSAFGWSYVLAQVPSGWLLDRFGSKRVYGFGLLFWSIFTFGQGFARHFGVTGALWLLLTLRLLLGIAEGPVFPANSRIVAAWFPTAERGTASAIFNSSQYFALVLFSPIMGWITHAFGWPYVFYAMGGLGIVLTIAWWKLVYSPSEHPRISESELQYIAEGGGLVNMDDRKTERNSAGPNWGYIRQLLGNRMLLGVYMGQYCITGLTYFFLTWFPVYLVEARHMSILKVGFVAAIPAVCGFVGGLLGGVASDWLLRKGYSLTFARKLPIVAGMLMSMAIVACNYVHVLVAIIAVMALAFFGKGFGALGWAVVADTSPKQIAGLSGGVFNMFGNVAAITTPIVIGYILNATGSFNWALVFVAANGLGALLSYLLVVGEIKRVELRTS